jgi:hypothetical protein
VHEALPDLHGVAVGGADARLVVDAGGDECWPAVGERGIDQAVEIILVCGPGALGEAGGAGERDLVGDFRLPRWVGHR